MSEASEKIMASIFDMDTVLPWTLPVPPKLTTGHCDGFTLVKRPMPSFMRGYFSGLRVYGKSSNYVLLDNHNNVWMSLSQMELESMAPMLDAAHGDVVIMGLGLGVLLNSVKKKPGVTSITLVEINESLVHMMGMTPGLLDDIEIVTEDALSWKPDRTYDIVLADIWMMVGDKRLEEDTKQIASNVKADLYSIWGIELAFVNWCAKNRIEAPKKAGTFARFAKELGVPMPDFPGTEYERLCFQAARNAYLT